jgi:hypothetical protein
MTPKEKAIELVNKMIDFTDWHDEDAKQCALIAVNEIIKSNPISFDKDDNCIASYWWVDVKKEIEQL